MSAGPESFTARLRARERLLGYWVVCDNPAGTERIAGLGFDYVVADAQHGLLDHRGWIAAMTAIDGRGTSAGLVRVAANDGFWIGSALDAGARGVIVPLVSTAAEAAAAVGACRYPPAGVRSYGPTRARVPSRPAEADAAVACIVMIETAGALRNLAAICATPGLDGVYVGPADLCLAIGGRYPGDPEVAEEFGEALRSVVKAAADAGLAAGFHCHDGATAARRLAEGFTFATVSSDLHCLEQAAAAQLSAARPAGA